MRLIGLVALALLAGCGKGPSQTERAAQDARDIAMVEAAQHRKPPAKPITLAGIVADDIQKYGLLGAGCSFTSAGTKDPVLKTTDKRAYIKLGTGMFVLASDPGSTQFPLGTWDRYIGKEYSLTIDKSGGDGTSPGQDTLSWPGILVVRDQFDQAVYRSAGDVRCGS